MVPPFEKNTYSKRQTPVNDTLPQAEPPALASMLPLGGDGVVEMPALFHGYREEKTGLRIVTRDERDRSGHGLLQVAAEGK